jgi:hypothetical protein
MNFHICLKTITLQCVFTPRKFTSKTTCLIHHDSWPNLGRLHHFPSYNIFCDWKWGKGKNNRQKIQIGLKNFKFSLNIITNSLVLQLGIGVFAS